MDDKRDDEFVWMRHTDPELPGWFQCAAAAVPAFEARGWEVADPDERPAEENPVVAELAAFQAGQAKATAKPAKKAVKSSTSAPSGDEGEGVTRG